MPRTSTICATAGTGGRGERSRSIDEPPRRVDVPDDGLVLVERPGHGLSEGPPPGSLPVEADFAEFWRGFEWMGLQRHLKVMGIFARLAYRDGKRAYLEDTPRFLGYARAVATRYAALAPLRRLLEELHP